MSIKIIQDKLERYEYKSQQDEENALKEITQELALYSLYNAGFFKYVAFQGGTCLRILYSLNRFSEDLDFALISPDPKFKLETYLRNLKSELRAYGYDLKIDNRKDTKAVQSLFLKDDSLGKLLNFQYPLTTGHRKAIQIKFEVDTNPPLGATVELKTLDFPVDFAITTHDLPSLFAGKSHALLCRKYIKGRDWYDFLWYVARNQKLNFYFLSNAINQTGPWEGKSVKIDMDWYQEEMASRIKSIDWQKAKNDVQRFLKPADLKTLEFWNTEFFLQKLKKLR